MENLSKDSAKAKLDINDAIYIDNNIETTHEMLNNKYTVRNIIYDTLIFFIKCIMNALIFQSIISV